MRQDVIISIFGKVNDPEAINALAEAAEEEGVIEWSEPFFADDIIDLLEDAAKRGAALQFTRSDTSNLFDEVCSACQEASLSYLIYAGPTGDDGYTDGYAWRPGLEKAIHFPVLNNDASITATKVLELLDAGPDVLRTHLNTLQEADKIGKIEIEPGFIDAYEALENDHIPSP